MERLRTEELQTLSVSRLEHCHRYLCAASLARGTVLDIACGVGYGADILLANPVVETYVGVDVEREAIAQALADPRPNARFLTGSAFHLPFGDDSFDAIVSLETVEHLDDPARALAEFRRVLRPDGVLVGSVPTAVFEAFCTAQYGPNKFHLQAFSTEELTALLGRFFPCVEIFVARVSLAAALYDGAGERGPFYRDIVAEASNIGSCYGSYVFVASMRPLGADLAKRFGVLSIGGSYFEAERMRTDRLLAAGLMEDGIAQIVRDKDRLVLERDQRIGQAEALIAAKDARVKTAEEIARAAEEMARGARERMGAAEALLEQNADRLRSVDAALEATRTELARMKGSRGWRMFCRLRNLAQFRLRLGAAGHDGAA